MLRAAALKGCRTWWVDLERRHVISDLMLNYTGWYALTGQCLLSYHEGHLSLRAVPSFPFHTQGSNITDGWESHFLFGDSAKDHQANSSAASHPGCQALPSNAWGSSTTSSTVSPKESMWAFGSIRSLSRARSSRPPTRQSSSKRALAVCRDRSHLGDSRPAEGTKQSAALCASPFVGHAPSLRRSRGEHCRRQVLYRQAHHSGRCSGAFAYPSAQCLELQQLIGIGNRCRRRTGTAPSAISGRCQAATSPWSIRQHSDIIRSHRQSDSPSPQGKFQGRVSVIYSVAWSVCHRAAS